MPKKKVHHEEHENHERWLISYADFITLLFAFFVVMYSISSINEGKFRVLSDSLNSAFRNQPSTMEPVQIGTPVKSMNPSSQQMEASKEEEQQQIISLQPIADAMEEVLADLIEANMAEIRVEDEWIEIDIKTTVLFPSGSAVLQQLALPILKKISAVLKQFTNPIHVEGFTDNVPISTQIFPSNWELSAARAASVVHLFMDEGVKPQQMVAIGYGEYRPIAPNNTSEGKQKNRRVVLVILANEDTRRTRQIQDSIHRNTSGTP